MTGQRRLNGDFRRLQVSNFTNHHNIWVLTQNRTQAFGKCQTNFWTNLNLNQPVNIIFYRVFSSNNLAVNRIEFFQGRVESSGLPRAGRPGHNQNPVRLINKLADNANIPLRQPQHIQPQIYLFAVENTKHHAFAEHGRQNTHTKVHRTAADHQRDTPVLRKTTLRNIKVGHHFNSA